MLEKVYGDSRARAFEWYKALKKGRGVVENLPRPRRSATTVTEENIDLVKKTALENGHYSLREISQKLFISHESVRHILADVLCARRVAARLVVTKELNFLQIFFKRVAEDMFERVSLDLTFMERIITGDETCAYEYDVPNKPNRHRNGATQMNQNHVKVAQKSRYCLLTVHLRYSWCCSLGISSGGGQTVDKHHCH